MSDQFTTTFGEVLSTLNLNPNFLAYREGWNGKDQFIKIQKPDLMSKMNLPYLYITDVNGNRCPWLASQTDMLSTDWVLKLEEQGIASGQSLGTVGVDLGAGDSISVEREVQVGEQPTLGI